MTDEEMQVLRVKARLNPELNEPYFQIIRHYQYGQRCNHDDQGVTLDIPARRVLCKGCGAQIDAFDALLQHAHAEQRLVNVVHEGREREKREAEQKRREKERRPFLRQVVGYVARRDKTLKAEPIIGYTLTLECEHTKASDGDRKPRRVTCYICQAAAKADGTSR